MYIRKGQDIKCQNKLIFFQCFYFFSLNINKASGSRSELIELTTVITVKMATLEDKILGEKLHNYCSSSEDSDDEKGPSEPNKSPPETPGKWEGSSTNTGPKGTVPPPLHTHFG